MRGYLLATAAAAALGAGCVERKYVITTDPPGAVVLENSRPLGTATPADGSFVYDGTYRFTLLKEGFQTLHVDQEIPTPWYQVFPLDFVSENLVPWTIQDVRRFHYQLQPLQTPNSQDVGERARQLRERGRAVVPPPPSP